MRRSESFTSGLLIGGDKSWADLGHSCTHCSVSFSTQSNPATAMNVDCDLWSLPAAETESFGCMSSGFASLSLPPHRHLPRRTGEPRGTVNGRWFLWDPYQKLTDSVECSPRHAWWEGFWTQGGAVAQVAEIRMSLLHPRLRRCST